jgi:hypothetical protein
MMPNIELTIDELVLHGFSPHDRARIGDAVHAELVRLLSRDDRATGLAQLGHIGRIDAGSFDVPAQASASDIGHHIAGSIVGGAVGAKR